MPVMKGVTYAESSEGKDKDAEPVGAEGGPKDEAELQILNRVVVSGGGATEVTHLFLLDKLRNWSSDPSTHIIAKHVGTCLQPQHWEKGAQTTDRWTLADH